ncbi:MAG: helix-turn-helix transcriptional regulator [Elusimicrobia bacterium]|nr:helix-turn-helix transcriptional regulator [Elusimicrobiota bacterium]
MKNPVYRKTYLVSRVRVAIAALIKTLREQAGMSQAQLAKLAGIPQSQVARLEGIKDKRIPSMDLLTNIFAALDCRAFLDVVPKHENTEKREIVLV